MRVTGRVCWLLLAIGGQPGPALPGSAGVLLPVDPAPALELIPIVTAGLAPPVAEYRNQRPRCAITGGYVYRGAGILTLRGAYVFGDYCSGEIMTLSDRRAGVPQVLLSTGVKISSFGQDQAGELYVVGHGGTVHRIANAAGYGQ